ncbi:MAG: hypothetical protein ABGY71_04575 [bacterium]|nr:hypothetical protein [Planctomycetota bacterium]HIL52437.1 hypothetical protein [Planctomycetota bacterium]
MHKILKYGLFGLGGFSLFLGSFTGIAALSGTPMHQVAGIGAFFDAPAVAPGTTRTSEEPRVANEEPAISGQDALERQAGLLGAWMVPSPFTGTELRSLQDELKAKFQENRELLGTLRARELELDEWEKTLQEKYNELADIRTKLEDMEGDLELRYAELERDEAAERSRELAGWEAQAELYKGGEPEINASMLANETPEDAALLMRALGPTAAGEILRLLEPPELRKAFMDAYRRVSETL